MAIRPLWQPEIPGRIGETTSHLTKAASCQVIGYAIRPYEYFGGYRRLKSACTYPKIL
jgi:hypothetical protein